METANLTPTSDDGERIHRLPVMFICFRSLAIAFAFLLALLPPRARAPLTITRTYSAADE